MDIRPILILALLFFSFKSEIYDFTKPIIEAKIVSVEIVKPEQTFLDFSKDLSGKITNNDDAIKLAVYYDEYASEILKYKNPSINDLLLITTDSTKQLKFDEITKKYPFLKDYIIKVFSLYSTVNDRKLSSEDLIDISNYFKGIAWNILNKSK